MKMQLSREQQITCHEAAVSHYKADTFLHPGMDSTYTKDKNLHELIAQYAEALGAEWIVAKYLGAEYDHLFQNTKKLPMLAVRSKFAGRSMLRVN